MSTPIQRAGPGRLARRLIAVAALSVALVSLSAVPAWSAVSVGQQGAALFTQMQNGQTTCGKLSSTNFAQMGEYAMGRIMGSTAAQNAMNAQMLATTGARGEQLAYQFMGERMGGCATGDGPVAFGTMMGMMGTTQMGASYGSAHRTAGYGPSMMGGYGSNQAASNSHISGGVIVAIVLGALALLALLILLATRRTPRLPTQPRTA